MAFSIDDGWDFAIPVVRAGNAAFGAYCRAGAWVARGIATGQITEPVVPGIVAAMWTSPELAQKLADAGLWVAVEDGWLLPHYLDRNPSADVMRRRKVQTAKRNALGRDPALRHAIRTRDQDRCRYCGITVRWSDRKGPQGGTYDHVDPDGPNSYENLVVSCRSCNSAKGSRTPEEAGMPLRAAPGTPSGMQIRSRSESRSDLDISRASTPPKGGKGARQRDALPPTHHYEDDGTGTCAHCPLPRIHKVHPAA